MLRTHTRSALSVRPWPIERLLCETGLLGSAKGGHTVRYYQAAGPALAALTQKRPLSSACLCARGAPSQGGWLASFKPNGMDWMGHLWAEWDAKNVGRKWRNCWFAGVRTTQLSVGLEDNVLIDLSTSVYLRSDLLGQYAFCVSSRHTDGSNAENV